MSCLWGVPHTLSITHTCIVVSKMFSWRTVFSPTTLLCGIGNLSARNRISHLGFHIIYGYLPQIRPFLSRAPGQLSVSPHSCFSRRQASAAAHQSAGLILVCMSSVTLLSHVRTCQTSRRPYHYTSSITLKVQLYSPPIYYPRSSFATHVCPENMSRIIGKISLYIN